MVKKDYTPEEIIVKLRETKVFLSQRALIAEVGKNIDITEQTYYRWRKEYGGIQIEQVKRFKKLEKENAGLKKLLC